MSIDGRPINLYPTMLPNPSDMDLSFACEGIRPDLPRFWISEGIIYES